MKSPANIRTRPTSDRLRETLFNIIGPAIGSKTRFLDLCAGTGAVGIEALSRGAGFATFIEKARRNCALIEENLDLLGVPEALTRVECADAEKFLRQAQEEMWHYVFFDPPYKSEYAETLSLLAENREQILTGEAVVIVEHHFKNHLTDEIGRLRRWRLLKQGETALSFYEAV